MNTWRLAQCGDDAVTEFAVSELKRYIRTMDSAATVDVILWRPGFALSSSCLLVGISEELAAKVPAVADPRLDDAIAISVQRGSGYITGSNPRSVLIAVYRFLREVGCAFVRPGPEGDVIPKKNALLDTVTVHEAASYRHRGLCNEGAQSCQHVCDLIDWLPKNAMNAYFTQAEVPYNFFRRWYEHRENPTLKNEPVTPDEMDGMTRATERQLHRRGLLYHAIGHGWTCIPAFHVNNRHDWVRDETRPCPEYAQYIAMVNGKRDLLPGYSPADTNLCYSNPYVRDSMTDAVRDYCLAHPGTDYVHFWLADGLNNHCECEACQERIPADWYVTLLNELDAKLTAAGVTTRVVFLIYVDLLWEPQQCSINNPDRFVLMFAPITRSYSTSFKPDKTTDTEHLPLAPYVRNRLTMPASPEENVARLNRWQAAFAGDSFDFDYHLMWAHFSDPSYLHIARVMHQDMVGLADIGLNGMVSCQEQRVFFPSGIVMEAMARGLWNRSEPFEAICADYFARCYGADGPLVQALFEQLAGLFDPPALRGDQVMPFADFARATADKERHDTAALAQSLGRMGPALQAFAPVVQRNLTHADPAVARGWGYLELYLQYAALLAEAFAARAAGDTAAARQKYLVWQDYVRGIEPQVHPVLDVYEAIFSLRKFFPAEQG